jgi:hypothetical protein
MTILPPSGERNCGGCIYNGRQYRRARGSTPHPKKRQSCFIKTGRSLSFRGYTWTLITDSQLIGYYNNKIYTSKSSALKVCGRSAGCKGVTKERPRRYRLNSSTTYKTVKGRKIWIQGSQTESLEDFDWTPKSNWRLTGRETRRYNKKWKAARACARWQYCNGYIKYSDTDYRLVVGSGFTYKKGVVTYVRGGRAFSTFTVFHEGKIFTLLRLMIF